jgi:hypothetical protein
LTYLAACLTYKNEAPYLREWIEFHRIVGVERFFLYDNGSTDEHAELLAPYVDQDIVTVEDWPGEQRQHAAYNHCLETHRDVSWIAFLDADEFLFSPGGQSVPSILGEFEEFPGVGVNLAQYATSGHVTRPSGLVIENYVYRFTNPAAKWVKSIVQPARTTRCLGAHIFEFESGHAVDVKRRPLDGWLTETFIQSRLRINHYYTKSLEELEAKLARVRADTGELREQITLAEVMKLEARCTRDLVILQYAPALRRALGAP